MRIVLVSEVYPPRAGGAGWSTRALALGLQHVHQPCDLILDASQPDQAVQLAHRLVE